MRITVGLGVVVHNCYERLDKLLVKDSVLRLCDIRDSYSNMSYQYSLSLLYRYAVHQLCGKVEVQMCNSLSKGLFTKIKGVNPTEKLCQEITDIMKQKIAENTILQWQAVRRGEEKNIFPYCGYADVFFNTQCSYELPVLKKYARPLLEEIPEDSNAYPEAQRILKFLQFLKRWKMTVSLPITL